MNTVPDLIGGRRQLVRASVKGEKPDEVNPDRDQLQRRMVR
jgi:hypothetical protein